MDYPITPDSAQWDLSSPGRRGSAGTQEQIGSAYTIVFFFMIVPLPWRGKAPSREVLFRPEDVAIVAPAEAELTGTVVAAIFLGDRTRLSISGVGAEPIIVEANGRQIFTLGDTIHLRIADGTLLCL
jgi:hypothetical protein